MAEIQLVRMPGSSTISEADREVVRRVLFGEIDGLGEQGRKAWRRFISGLMRMEPGEMATITTRRQRSGPFHRRHFAIVTALFEAQERFEDDENFIVWLKFGAGWVTWVAGPNGGVVPIPKSVSYAEADDESFRDYHERVMRFLRGPRAARYLWPHLKDRAEEMMDSVLVGFDE